MKYGENVSKLVHEKFRTKWDGATEAEEIAFSRYLFLQENLCLCKSPQSLRTGGCLIYTRISLGGSSAYSMSLVFLLKAFLIGKCGLTQEML